MLAILSPAKSLNLNPLSRPLPVTQPPLLDQAEVLVKTTRRLSADDLKGLMKISDKLAALNHQRYQDWTRPFTADNAKPAALTFAGDTYIGLRAEALSDEELGYAQDHVAMLSGLYGVLRPLDLMQAYRLEMGTRLDTRRGKNLYEFWGGRITAQLNAMTEAHADRTVVNLASNEYFKAVVASDLAGGHVTPVFKEVKDGAARVIGLTAKRARGAMARWIVERRIERREQLVDYAGGDYRYRPELSTDTDLVFTRAWRSMAKATTAAPSKRRQEAT